MEERNAKIISTVLGIEDHGIMQFSLTLDYGNGSVQGFGGWALDEYKKTQAAGPGVGRGMRVGTDWGMEAVMRILRALRVDSWEKLKGQHCRARIADGLIVSIGHIIENSWWEKPSL